MYLARLELVVEDEQEFGRFDRIESRVIVAIPRAVGSGVGGSGPGRSGAGRSGVWKPGVRVPGDNESTDMLQ